MKILKCTALRGANIFSYRPVLWIKLSLGSLYNTSSDKISGFNDALLTQLPSLHEHRCSVGRSGGFVERLQEGTYLAHIFEHVQLELQALSGDDVSFGKARVTADKTIYDVIVGYRNESVAFKAAEITEAFLNALVNGQSYQLSEQLVNLKKLRAESGLGPSAAAIYLAAKKRDIPIQQLGSADLFLLGYGSCMKKVWSSVTENTSLLASDIVADKQLTAQLLRQYGIPTVENRSVKSLDEARNVWYEWQKCAVVIKPLAGSHGNGVAVGIKSEAELEQGWQLASQYSSRLLIEKYVSGRQYRFCMINYHFAAAAERLPAYVIGDGVHSVYELVEMVNKNPLRGAGHNRPLTRIELDEAADMVLKKQSMSANQVPEKQQVVKVRDTANLSAGGTAVDITSIVPLETVRLMERAARLIGLDIAGIDVIAKNITRPLNHANGAVIEINASPGLRMHSYPTAGQSREVGGEIVDYLFPYESNGRIPIAAVTGTNGKTTVTRMLGSIFQHAGFTVGMATTEGVYLNQECQLKGDCSGPVSARNVLHDKRVEAAVLETARGGIVRAGLGFDRCDIGIVTNISEDHFGQDGIESLEDLFFIKSLILEMVAEHGAAVINADDSFAARFAERVQGEIIYFSMNPDNVLIHRLLSRGGRSVYLKNGNIYLAAGEKSEMLMAVKDIPVTMQGNAEHNIQNALAAAAAGYGYGIDKLYIKKALHSFAYNKGRLAMFRTAEFQVCVDYGHNLAGYQAMIQTARRLSHGRLVGVIGAPGDRRDDVIFRIGEMAGMGFDCLYIKEDEDLRGRHSGETANLLKAGAISGGFEQSAITVILSEAEAVRTALRDGRDGDFIIVFYENYELVVDAVQKFIDSQSVAGKIPLGLETVEQHHITGENFLQKFH